MTAENSTLSSQNSKLKELYQGASDEIVKKDEYIAMLSNSDQELKEALKIKAEASEEKSANEERSKKLDERESQIELEKVEYKEKCYAEVLEVEARCQKDNDEAARRLENAKEYEMEIKEMKENEEKHIQRAAEIIAAREIGKLNQHTERRINEKCGMLEVKYAVKKGFPEFVFASLLLFTACFGILSERLGHDAFHVGEWLVKAGKATYKTMDGWGRGIEKWLKGTDSIVWMARPVHILTIVLIMAVIIGVIGLLVFLYVRFLRDKDRFNATCRWIMAGTGFFCISIARLDPPILSGINLILVWLAIQLLIPVVQELYRRLSGKHKNWAFISGVIASVAVLLGGFYLIGRFILMRSTS